MTAATARVLTVEDDPIVRADLRLVLEEAGFDVCADARDGIEAVELARAHTPDLILLDLGLPRLGGVEAAREILRDRQVPIVALTGRSSALANKALEAGAVGLLRKPFVVADLVRTVRDALTVSRERQASRSVVAEIVGPLGYPESWAVELEEAAFRAGHAWKRSG